MRVVLILMLLVSAILSGCSNVSAPYLIQKDRVDQEFTGNRGYLAGKPPEIPVKRKFSKRTLIGIDIEIPLLPGEEGYKPTSYKGRVIRMEDIKMDPKKAK